MEKIKAGVVVVTKFCKAESKKFTAYVNYIDRKEAARTENSSKYNLYQDYMGNPEKTTGLFTQDKNELTENEKEHLKQVFEKAQEKDSLMWQTVISFDNRWLEKNHLYNSETEILDEETLKNVVRKAVNKMLKAEGLENAMWSGAIHYNTDNIHVHIATVEPEPMREKNEYVQYRYRRDATGKKVREPMKDAAGNIIRKEEYKGRFRQESIQECKRSVVNEIMQEKENNRLINDILRGSILIQKQNHQLAKDRILKQDFLKLYQKMPDCNRNMWNYNNPIMSSLRPSIDKVSNDYLREYHPEEFKKLQELIVSQSEKYQEAYGLGESFYAEGKMQDVYTRLGNAILKEIREYDKELKKQGVTRDLYRKEQGNGGTPYQKSGKEYTNRIASGMSLRSAISRMKRGLKSEWEKARNIREHERMMQYGSEKE